MTEQTEGSNDRTDRGLSDALSGFPAEWEVETTPASASRGLLSPMPLPTSGSPDAAVSRRAALATASGLRDWANAQAKADELLESANVRLRAYRSSLGDPAKRLRAPLSAMLMAAQTLHRNTRPSTVAALVFGYVGDVAEDDAAVDSDGTVAPGSIAYRVLDALIDLKEAGVPNPHDAVEAWSGDDKYATLTQALLLVLGTNRSGLHGGGTHEQSALNFEVPITAPTGRTLDQIRTDLDARPGIRAIKDVIEQFAAVQPVNAQRREHELAVVPGSGGTKHFGQTVTAQKRGQLAHGRVREALLKD